MCEKGTNFLQNKREIIYGQHYIQTLLGGEFLTNKTVANEVSRPNPVQTYRTEKQCDCASICTYFLFKRKLE